MAGGTSPQTAGDTGKGADTSGSADLAVVMCYIFFKCFDAEFSLFIYPEYEIYTHP